MNRFDPGTHNSIATELLKLGIEPLDAIIVARLNDQLHRVIEADDSKIPRGLDALGVSAHVLALRRLIGINLAMIELGRDPSAGDAAPDVDNAGTEPTDAD